MISLCLAGSSLTPNSKQSEISYENTYLIETKIPITPNIQVLGDITNDNYKYWLLISEKYPEYADLLTCLIRNESGFDPEAIGDYGLAHSWYQIHYLENGISKECAYDLMCATDWTVSELQKGNSWKWSSYKKCQ